MATVGLSRDTAIEARAPEEAKVTAMMTAAWRVGSVFILNANFMPKILEKGGNCVEKRKECAGEAHSRERKEPGTMQPTKLWQQHLHGL
jgi:hypothetical protein